MTGHFDGDRSLSYEKSRFAILGSALNPVGLPSHWCKGSSDHVWKRQPRASSYLSPGSFPITSGYRKVGLAYLGRYSTAGTEGYAGREAADHVS
jgi:hypothetical protein